MINIYILSLGILFSPIWFLQSWPPYFYPPGRTFEGFPLLNTSSYKEKAKGINTEQWPWDWKKPVFIPISKKGNAKESSNYPTIALISYISKVMLKRLQAKLQQCELRTLRHSRWIQKRQRNQRSNCQHLFDHQKSKTVID